MSGPLVFVISAAGVSFNYFIPDIIPLKIIAGMYWVVSMSVVAMSINLARHLKNPDYEHFVVGHKCRKCQMPLMYVGEKCSNPDCDYEVRFQ